MGQEIERKFLVDKEKWDALKKPAGVHYRQGYLSIDPERTVRVRIAGDTGYITIKGKSIGAKRAEYEYEIPKNDAEELIDSLSISSLSKIRYKINVDEKCWEIDEFLEENSGLLMAEIELQTEDETFTIPDWISEEVTDDLRFYNSNLVINPFKNWNE